MTVHYGLLSPVRPPYLGGGQWLLEGLTDVTIIFGRNSSGKSILLRNLCDQYKESSNYTSPERAGLIAYDQNIMNQELNVSSRGSNRRGKNQAPKFREETVSRIGSLKMKMRDKAGRGVQIKPRWDKIEEDIDKLLPEFQFSITELIPPFELKRIPTDDSPPSIVQAGQLSSGETEMLTLALDLLTICNIWVLEEQVQRLLLVDEPDTHLHPDLQVRLAQFLIGLIDAFDAQLLVATHSTTLLSSIGHFGAHRVGVVYLNNSQPQQRIIKFDKTLRELSTCLGGHALMGPLFGAPLLLVEGDDDYRIWSQVPRHPGFRHSFAVIPCNGDEIYTYQATLESLFGSLRESGQSPAGFSLLDGDQKISPDCPQEHVKFLKLNCRESENLYLSDEVLVKLRTTWAQAQVKVIEQADSYGEHSKILKACNDWNTKETDIKNVINSLADILDDKKLHWTVRLGKTLGEKKPVGQLAAFLGPDTIEALWGL